MRTLRLFLRTIPFLLASSAVLADDNDIVYLRCKADPEYIGAPHIVIDKIKRMITIVPIKEGLPLLEDEISYEGKVIFEQQIVIRLTVNKFTLRYTMQTLMEPRFATGQCIVEQKKL